MTFDIKPWDGKPISEPGIYDDIRMSDYHGQLTVDPSTSGSGLKTVFYDSPAHYYLTSYLNPEREPEEPNEALLFGRGAHHLILGEHHFSQHFLTRPTEYPEGLKFGDSIPRGHTMKPWSGNSLWCKGWLEAAAKSGLDTITVDHLKHIRGMAASLERHPLVQAGILNGLVEHSFVWRHPSGVWLKWRPDAIPGASLDFADLKTIADISDEGIERAISLGYHMQAALGALACRAVLGQDMESFSFVFVEKKPPYTVRVKTLQPGCIDLGVKQIEAAVKLFARSVESGQWTGPGGVQTDAEYAGLTPWAISAAERRLAQIEAELSA